MPSPVLLLFETLLYDVTSHAIRLEELCKSHKT